MTKRNGKWVALVATLTGTLMAQLFPTGCAPYFATIGALSFDFCSVLNCNSSTYFDLCNPNFPVLIDCPTNG